MTISGETIRQVALEREQTCPEAMKGSFYYGFREGAKWMQGENPILKDVAEGKAIIVDTKWLEEHDKKMILKACETFRTALINFYPTITHSGMVIDIDKSVEQFKQVMEE